MSTAYKPLASTSKDAIVCVMSAISQIEKGHQFIYPVVREESDHNIIRLLNTAEAKHYQAQPVNAKEWVEEVVRNNMSRFNLEGGWSEFWSNKHMDLRLVDPDEDGKGAKVIVVPWNSEKEEHDHDNEWVLFLV